MILRSQRLTTRHGFSTRQGGVSSGRYESLNLSYKWGDDQASVDENRRRFAHEAGFALEQLFTTRQVHGAEVLRVDAASVHDTIAGTPADGLVTDRVGVALAIGTADCVPILISDGHGRVAALHAGWRGTVADIAARGVEAMVALGADRAALVAAFGPCICVRCFEVGEEVAAQFEASCVDRGHAKPHVDLRRQNRLLLERAGVHDIDDAPPCTMCEPERFFSFRRDGGHIGQQLSVIVGGA